ncbi:MAG: magnesium transporter [bacterium]|nr:magnesium transporter [bacterium]
MNPRIGEKTPYQNIPSAWALPLLERVDDSSRSSIALKAFLCYNTFMTHLVSHHLVTRIPTTTADASVADVRHLIEHAKTPWDSVNYIYVLDDTQKLIGVVSIKELLTAKNDAHMAALMRRDPKSIHEHAHEERVVALAVAHSLKAIPVVDHDGRFLGVVPSDAILSILHKRHTEEFLRHGGFMQPHVHFLDVMKARFGELFRARVGWLAVGLFGGMLAAWVTNMFEPLLSAELLLAFFIPLVLYLSAAVGGQAGMLFIRSLAVERVSLRRYFWRELCFALVLGILFGILGYVIVWGIWGSTIVAEILGVTLFLGILISTIVALVIPTLLLKLGRDPAVGSGPFATIVQDVLSLTIYFFIASLLI